MNEVIQLLTSPVFWIGTVLVGILINIVSAYTKVPIDSLLNKFGSYFRDRSEKRKATIENLKREMQDNIPMQIFYGCEMGRLQTVGLIFTTLSVALLLSGAAAIKSIWKIDPGITRPWGETPPEVAITLGIITSVSVMAFSRALSSLNKTSDIKLALQWACKNSGKPNKSVSEIP